MRRARRRCCRAAPGTPRCRRATAPGTRRPRPCRPPRSRAGAGHVGLVALHLEIDHEGHRRHGLDPAHTREKAVLPLYPVALAGRGAADAGGQFGDGGYAQIVALADAVRMDAAAIGVAPHVAAPVRCIGRRTECPGAAVDSERLGQRRRGVGEVDLAAGSPRRWFRIRPCSSASVWGF